MARTLCRIEMFGALRVQCAGRTITHFETRKTAALLAYLAYHLHRSHPREVLAEMLWPEEDPDATRVRLRQALAALRRALYPLPPPGSDRGAGDVSCGGDVLIADRADVRLDPGSITTDVVEFELVVRQAGRTSNPVQRTELLR